MLRETAGRFGGTTLSIPVKEWVEGAMTGIGGRLPGDLGGVGIRGDRGGVDSLDDLDDAISLGDLDGVDILLSTVTSQYLTSNWRIEEAGIVG